MFSTTKLNWALFSKQPVPLNKIGLPKMVSSTKRKINDIIYIKGKKTMGSEYNL